MFKPGNNLITLPMSTRTWLHNQSTPNQWVRSTMNVYTDTSTKLINAKPMGAIRYQCLNGHKHSIDQCKINGCNQLSMSTQTQACNRSMQINEHDQLSMSTQTQARNWSMPNQWVRSAINVYTDTSTKSINAKPMDTISYQCLHRHKH